jgi:hypothetical protein
VDRPVRHLDADRPVDSCLGKQLVGGRAGAPSRRVVDERLVGQLADRHDGAAGQRVIRQAAKQHGLGGQRGRRQPRLVRAADRDEGGIQGAAPDIGDHRRRPARSGPWLDVHQRSLPVKPCDQCADVDHADHLHHAEPQRAAQAFLGAEDRRLVSRS